MLQFFLLPALTVTCGLQLLCVFIPSLAWYLKDTVGLSSLALAPIACGTFACSFLAPLLMRRIGIRRALWLTAGGVALVRVVEQVVHVPIVDLVLSTLGTILFLLFLPVFLQVARSRFVLGLVWGFSIASLIRGFSGTLDLSWIPGPIPIVVTGALAAVMGWCLVSLTGDSSGGTGRGRTRRFWLLMVGPFFFLQLMFLQNQGWVAATLGISSVTALIVVMSVNVVIGGLASLVTGDSSREAPLSTCWLSIGMMLFIAMLFAYYVSFDLALPISRNAIIGTAVIIVVVGCLTNTRLQRPTAHHVLLSTILALTLIIPTLWWAHVSKPLPLPLAKYGFPMRVMTYNIHSAYNVAGRQDPEAIARVIEESGADIVALQEVSRGWLIDGPTDLVAWFERRLRMRCLFAATADRVWGNAILTRMPILDHGAGQLPRSVASAGIHSLLGRGYLWAKVDVGLAEPLLVITTHLHHLHRIPGDDALRFEQLRGILDFWLPGRPQTILLGDLNAEPASLVVNALKQAEFIDTWREAGSGMGWTWPAERPEQRIDWLWHTRDLQARQARVIPSPASDHFPVVALFAAASSASAVGR